MTPQEKEFANSMSGLHYSNGHQQNIATGYCTPDCSVCNRREENQKWMAFVFIASMLLMAFCSGCAEVGLYDRKQDCHEQGATRERNTPFGYPCHCCPQGE